MAVVKFFGFLFHAEDSSGTLTAAGRKQQFARHNDCLYGAIKIIFWIGMTVIFWGGLPTIIQWIDHHL